MTMFSIIGVNAAIALGMYWLFEDRYKKKVEDKEWNYRKMEIELEILNEAAKIKDKKIHDAAYREVKLQKDVQALKNSFFEINTENTILKRRLSEYQRSRANSPSMQTGEREIIATALKKAMVSAHPDKGGNSDEFIKYNELYKKYK